jgi:tripartite-type tricarboxylate transporter receptor subunit TctC
VLKSKPDGYTAVMFGSSPLIGAYREDNLPYDAEDLKNLSIITIHKLDDLIIVAHPDKPWSTWEGLAKYAKEHPGKLNIGCGLMFHLLTENMFRQAGIDIKWVPYDSSSTALSDFMGGHVDLNAHVLTTVNALLKEKKAVGLLYDGPLDPKDYPTLQGIPSASKLGYEGILLGQPMAFPPGTPDEIVKFASKAMGNLLKDPKVIEIIKKAGGAPYYLPSEEAQKKHEESMDFIEIKLKEMGFID